VQCEQIRPYHQEYQEGSLAPYKAAWVVQHLAGCEACRTHFANRNRTTPDRNRSGESARVAVARRSPASERANQRAENRSARRAAPNWYRTLALLALIAIGVGTIWTVRMNIAGDKWTLQEYLTPWRIKANMIE
jgi:predicted anti-sigma-YlaC factor YlaD